MPSDLILTIIIVIKHVIGLHCSQIIHSAILRQFIFTEIIISSGVDHTSIVGGEGVVADATVVWLALVVADHQWVKGVAVHVYTVHVRVVVRHVETG